jgi:methyl-accepting chemotaxis protein
MGEKINQKEVKLIQASWLQVAELGPQAAELFYQILFKLDPKLKPLFKSDMAAQGKKLLAMLNTVVEGLNNAEKLLPAVQELGKRHVAYKVLPEHYDTVGQALLDTLQQGLGEGFNQELRDAWQSAYLFLATVMKDAAAQEQQTLNTQSKSTSPRGKVKTSVTAKGKSMDTTKTTKAQQSADLEGQLAAINKVMAVIHFNLDGTIIDANENFLATTGYTLDEIKGQHHRIFCEPSYAESPEYKQFWQDLNEGEFADGEFKRFGKGGNEVWIKATYNPIFDADGQVFKVVKFASDITEQKKANADYEGQIRAVNKAQAVIHFNLDGTIIDANENFLATTGYTLDEIKGQHHKIFCDPSYVESAEYKQFWQDLNDGKFADGEFKRFSKSGDEVWIKATYNPIFDADGQVFKVVKFASNITAEKKAQDKAAQLAGAMGNSNTASMLVNRDFEVTYANKATLELLKENEEKFQKVWPGFIASEESLLGTCIDTFHKNPAHQRNLLSDPSNLPFNADIQIDDLTFELNVTGIFDSNGDYLGNALEWQNVTEIRRNQLQVGRLSSAVEGMTTNLMMASPDGDIVYMNPAVEQMMRRREQQLRKVIPSFNVDTLVGTNFDTFHKNPAHQRNLLGNPANMPYNVQIKVAGLEFDLTAIALLDEQGNHVGSAVQWVDITEQQDAQRQVERLIQSAIKGELDARIDTAEYQDFMKDLGDNRCCPGFSRWLPG